MSVEELPPPRTQVPGGMHDAKVPETAIIIIIVSKAPLRMIRAFYGGPGSITSLACYVATAPVIVLFHLHCTIDDGRAEIRLGHDQRKRDGKPPQRRKNIP